MHSRFGLLEPQHTCEVRQHSAPFYRHFGSQHRNGSCVSCYPSSVHLALIHNIVAEDSTDWYIHAWRLVSHYTPMSYDFTALCLTQRSVTVISIVRLPILLPKLNLSSWNLDYSFVHSVTWSIAESNLTIVAGTSTYQFLQTHRLNSFTACLPSLGPILSLILYGEANPSTRHTRGKAHSRPWTRNQSSAVMQMHGQPTSSSEIRQSFVPLSDEAYGFSGMEQLHGTASTGPDERRYHDCRDIEMQSGSRWTNKGIQVRTDVTVQSA